MFNTRLPFRLLSVRYEHNPRFHLKTDIYRIQSKEGAYIAEVENYQQSTFVIKFYPVRFKRLKYKYQIISGDEVIKELLGTCLTILQSYFNKNPLASFGFMATGSIIEDFEEDQENNQRFRIYRQIMQNFFGVKTFAHYIDVTYSAYLMANRGNRLSEFIPYMQDNFKDLYPDILNLQFIEA